MPNFFIVYMSVWIALCAIALIVGIRIRKHLEIAHIAYWRSLLVPWKLISFAVATASLTAMAPYTGDPTWDYADAAFMSLFTFTSAPWAVGIIYQGLRGWQPLAKIYIACCLWMFSASWSYDLYIVLRDGEYPITWSANMAASSVLYASAGLLWSLEWRADRGVIFGFLERDWPANSGQQDLRRLLWYALPFMLLATAMIVPFLIG